ncbi:MAG: RagB/SusD family nutrient uptake outer membrane protein [Prolixibacteraceae bacterium]|nr:RagB/SusD family nutrient uptake outer membrane protein [Prolixibacteraceae bacterium]
MQDGTSGHIQITAYRDNKREFTEPKYYFYPIPTAQVVLNTNLKQLYGW